MSAIAYHKVIPVDQSGSNALPLPSGAATESAQNTANISLVAIATAVSNAATAALQSTGNTSLAAIAASVAGATPTGANHIGQVGGAKLWVTTELIRPSDTTAYAANDIVSDSTSATTVQALASVARANGTGGYIVAAKLTTNKVSITPRFRVHVFNTAPATVAADNAAAKWVYADLAKRLGWFDLPAMSSPADTANSDISTAIDTYIRLPFLAGAATQNLLFVLETLDAFTPASGQKFSLSVMVEPD